MQIVIDVTPADIADAIKFLQQIEPIVCGTMRTIVTHGSVSSDAPDVVKVKATAQVPAAPHGHGSSVTTLAPVGAGGVGGGSSVTTLAPVGAGGAGGAGIPAGAIPDVDSEGTPWDARIHSGGKSLTAAGVWQKRKGVSPEEVARIGAELRAARAGMPPPVATTPAPPTEPERLQAEQAATLPPPVVAAPPAPPAPAPVISDDGKWEWDGAQWQPRSTGPVPPPPPVTMTAPGVPAAPAPTTSAVTWPMICQVVQAKAGAGVTLERINEVSARHGANPVALAAAMPQVWPTLYAELSALV